MIGYVIYEDTKLPYHIQTNKKLKNFYIQIHPELGVLVKNPNFSLQKVHDLVQSKAKWIYEKSLLLERRESLSNLYETEGKVLLFGEKQSLHVKKKLEDFYKEKTKEIVEPTLKKYSNLMDVYPTKVSYRKAKKRWGSCSGKNALSLNSSIAQLPLFCIEYIIIHELAHIKYKHHQKSFWNFVSKFCDYKKCEQEIKKYSPAF
jgi:predicted metal-dependent hydrolase